MLSGETISKCDEVSSEPKQDFKNKANLCFSLVPLHTVLLCEKVF